jgi:hypothetical protein
MGINDTTPEQWDALRKKHPAIVGKYEDYFKKPKEECMVENPSHYNAGGIECIEAIKASMSTESYTGYLKGNVQKYVWRYEDKNGLEDLRKAQWYLNTLIDVLWEE